MKHTGLLFLTCIALLAMISQATAETTLIFTGNTHGEHSPCPS